MRALLLAIFMGACIFSAKAFSDDASSHMTLAALDDGSLSDISGREGIAIDLELRVNTDAVGKPLQSLNYCSGNNNPCRIAFNFLNRESGAVGQKGEWIVWKDYYGLTRINNLWIDAGQTPAVASGYQDVRTEAGGNRFMNGSGTCLLDSSKTAATCYQGVLNKPALMLKFNNGQANGIELFMNLGRVSTEYGPTGYGSDDRGSSLGVLIGDTTGIYAPAKIKIGGRVGLYGF